jgi:CBS-domain-containing membrane protein
VITVAPAASIYAAARLMLEHRIGGLPVVDQQGELVGILTDADLLVRRKPRRRRPWWRLLYIEGEELAREYRKTEGVTVRETMSSPVLTAEPGASLESIAETLEHHRIRRLPVVAGRRVVGIVSRGDLIKNLAAAQDTGGTVPDEQLVRDMGARLYEEPWVSNPRISVKAKDGVISLWGQVASEEEREAIEAMARSIPGCRGVENQLTRVAVMPYDKQV